MEMGIQPLDQLLGILRLQNSVLVSHSKEQLTHKVVAKGRKGRRLTLNAQLKILHALNACQSQAVYQLSDLFNYKAS